MRRAPLEPAAPKVLSPESFGLKLLDYQHFTSPNRTFFSTRRGRIPVGETFRHLLKENMMKRQKLTMKERVQSIAFKVMYQTAHLLGDWDCTWTGECRLAVVGQHIGLEHRAHDGVRTYRFVNGTLALARKLADQHALECETQWAMRASDFELLAGLRHTAKMMERFASNKAVISLLEMTEDAIYEEVIARGLQSEAKKARQAA